MRRILSLLIFPVPIFFLLSVLGLYSISKNHKKFGWSLTLLTSFIFFLLCSSPIADTILAQLEQKYPPLADAQFNSQISTVVVLGGGNINEPNFPPSSQLTDSSLNRLIEGIRVLRKLKAAKLLLSGGSTTFGNKSEAQTMAVVAESLGVPTQQIILEEKSQNTEEQAAEIGSLVASKEFYLVTSAFHMPRAMAMFHRHHLAPIAAPADFTVEPDRKDFYLGASWLRKSEIALYEFLALAKAYGLGRL